MFANIYLYLSLFSQLVKNRMLLTMINSDFSQKSFVMLYVKNVCKYIYIFIFSIGEKPDKLRFQPEIKCEECLQISIYIYPYKWCHMLLSMINSDFSREIICNAVCEECLQISIYIYPLFSQMVSNDMLLSMINSDFSQKSFVMLYVKNVCKYLFIFTPYFLNWCQTTCC